MNESSGETLSREETDGMVDHRGMEHGGYVVITPVKNEEPFVEKTLDSMAAQEWLPSEWLILDDGSTDQTAAVIERYAENYDWMRLLRLPASERGRGGHIVRVFYEGLRQVRTTNYQFLVKLDGDLSFEPGFFRKALAHMGRNPRLGITSGISQLATQEGVVREPSSRGHTLGASKIYRKRCFEEIGGLTASMGWDGIDEIRARMLGWEAEPVPGLVVTHLRPEGAALGTLRSGIERGRGCFFMGYHPIYLLLRSVRRSLASPMDGIGMLSGFISALVRREGQIEDQDFIRFLRTNQMRKLMFMRHKI